MSKIQVYKLRSRVDDLETRSDLSHWALIAFEIAVITVFAAVNIKFDSQENRISALELSLSALELSLGEIENKDKSVLNDDNLAKRIREEMDQNERR